MSDPVAEITEADLSPNDKPLWQKAANAVQVGNHGYAITIIQAILKEYPGFINARRILRKCMISEVNKKGGVKKGLFGSPISGLSKIASQAEKEPLAAIPLIEKELEKDPGNADANELLHKIALGLGFKETAAFALETVRENYPDNTKLLHKLADYYLGTDEPALAAEVYNDIVKADPTDSDAIKGAKDATAQASMKKGGWSGNGGPQKKDQAEFEELEAKSRTGLTREQLEGKRDKLAEEYAADQNNIKVVKELGDTYEQLEDWMNAYTFYDWAFQISNGDVSLQHKASEMKERAAETELEGLKKQLEADPENAELAAQVADLEKVKIESGVEEAKARVDQNPTDPKLRYAYGQALYNAGDYSEAIPHLQQATRNPHIRIKVLLLLGQTFEKKNMLDLAIKQLSDANSELAVMDGTKKDILYNLGLIYEKKGDSTAALDSFKKIYEVDYGYRDVAQRVESAY